MQLRCHSQKYWNPLVIDNPYWQLLKTIVTFRPRDIPNDWQACNKCFNNKLKKL